MGMPFNQAFSLPAELTLKTTPAGIRLCAQPIKELEMLRGEPQTADGQTLMPGKPLRFKTDGQLFDIVVEVQPRDAKEIKLQFGASQVTYTVAAAKLDEMPLPLIAGKVKFRVVVDRPIYEVIGGNGDVYRTARRGDPGKGGFVHGDPGVPRTWRGDGGKAIDAIELSAVGGEAKIEMLRIYPMQSIWKK